jgi:hypothetical protein
MTIEIQLTRGYVAIVDDCDADLASLKWHSTSMRGSRSTKVYASRSNNVKPRKKLTIHRVIAERIVGRVLKTGEQVDHINNDGLDNRRANIRVCSQSENMRNRRVNKNNESGFKGVTFHKRLKRWQAQIQFDSKNVFLGLFSTPEEAHEAYVTAAVKYFGEYANDGTQSLAHENRKAVQS